ncbi:hypothetical protein BGZ73_007760, partial [Actinomortierella ambigua]
MKFTALVLATSLLSSVLAAEYLHICAPNCNHLSGTGPTYTCGHNNGFKYYDSKNKWWKSTKEYNGGMDECCGSTSDYTRTYCVRRIS